MAQWAEALVAEPGHLKSDSSEPCRDRADSCNSASDLYTQTCCFLFEQVLVLEHIIINFEIPEQEAAENSRLSSVT